ncbi:MAG: transposase [Xenococcaceae cyanobacterium MO_207.B15]|nr:transposase [Xenococcaceae cyanobacterium MO_207.B15]
MRQVERHIVKEKSFLWKQIDELCFLSKNLYNYANYLVRQSFIFEGVYLGYNKIYHLVKDKPDYQALPRKVSQQVLKGLDKNWKSFFEASSSYKENPEKFTGRPKLPKYKHKTKGRNLLTYTIQAISKPWLSKGIIKLSGTDIFVPTKTQVENIVQARIIPKIGSYVIEIVYELQEAHTVNNNRAVAAIDIGLDNLAALTSNLKGFKPILVNGRPLKSSNQFYNKNKALLQSKLKGKKQSSKQINRLTAKRNNQVDTYLHQASRWIINHLDKHGIGKLIIGKNPLWKQEVNNGKKNNQSFVFIPHARFIEMLIYKGKMKGIDIICSEESYTSKASFLSLDKIPVYGSDEALKVKFSGYRETRGMYKIKGQKTRINADVNGSYNIMRKVIPTVFDGGIEGVVVRPTRVTPGRVKNT